MSVFRRLKNFFSSCATQLAQPAEDRPLFRLVIERKVQRIVEIGLSDPQRTVRLLETARKHAGDAVRYTGIDLFEMRRSGTEALPLKQAHRLLAATSARVQLVPGDPFAALSRVANSLPGTQLLLISAEAQGPELDRAWFYVPRILAENAAILCERPGDKPGETIYQPLSAEEIAQRLRQAQPRRLAA